jgi:hypothetical protein
VTSFTNTQEIFMEHIRNPDENPPPQGIEDRRLQIYRELFFNNIKGFLSNSFPVLESLYSEQDWNKLARTFFVQYDCQSPYFVDISHEFLAFLQHQYQRNDCDPKFMLELAHYEWVELDISIRKETRIQRYWDGKSIIGKVTFSELAQLLSYQFPVHQIKPDFQPTESGDPVYLVVYRNNEYKVNFTSINNVSAHMLTLLQTDTLSIADLTSKMSEALPQVPIENVKNQIEALVSKLLTQQILCMAE